MYRLRVRALEIYHDLQAWSRSVQRGENRAAVDLSEETWAKIFAKIKPWKATGPDGIQGFWWKKIPEARERLKSWCLDALQEAVMRLRERSYPAVAGEPCVRNSDIPVAERKLAANKESKAGALDLHEEDWARIFTYSQWLRNNVSTYQKSTGMLALADGPVDNNHHLHMNDIIVHSPKWDDIVNAQEGTQRVAEELRV
ncbi:hypothetical protein COOONC_04198 [Cooperia oncophora]